MNMVEAASPNIPAKSCDAARAIIPSDPITYGGVTTSQAIINTIVQSTPQNPRAKIFLIAAMAMAIASGHFKFNIADTNADSILT